jgi:cobalt-zinc-cadmium efflux system outer membrane protein
VTQTFETAGKRGLRIESAAAGVATAEAERLLLERQVAARVTLAYWTAAAANGLRGVLQQSLVNFDQVVSYHRARVAEGAMAEVDLMRVLLERDRLAVTAANAEAAAAQAVISLLRAMGRTEFGPVEIAESLADTRTALRAPDVAAVLSLRPDLAAARRILAQAQARLKLERAAWKPDPQALFGYKRSAGFNTLIGGLQLDLPFRNRNQGEIAAATAEIRAAEARIRATESEIRGEIESAWATYLARRRLLTETLAPMRQRADEIARVANAAYREGAVDLLRLLDAERVRLETLTQWYHAMTEYQISVTTLQIVTGAPL